MKFIAALILLSTPGAFAADKTLTQAQFSAEIQKSLPTLFCGKDAYFRKCFQVSEADCGATAKSSVEECAKEMKEKLPASFSLAAEGQKWGQEIGNCAGGKFELAQATKKTDSPDCKNPDKWK